MTKENWIQHILESADTIQQVEPDHLFTQKIQQRLNDQKKPLSLSFYMKWSAAAILLVIINIGVISNSSRRHSQHSKNKHESNYISNSFDNSVSYNY